MRGWSAGAAGAAVSFFLGCCLPHWPCGKVSVSRVADPGFHNTLCAAGLFSDQQLLVCWLINVQATY